MSPTPSSNVNLQLIVHQPSCITPLDQSMTSYIHFPRKWLIYNLKFMYWEMMPSMYRYSGDSSCICLNSKILSHTVIKINTFLSERKFRPLSGANESSQGWSFEKDPLFVSIWYKRFKIRFMCAFMKRKKIKSLEIHVSTNSQNTIFSGL